MMDIHTHSIKHIQAVIKLFYMYVSLCYIISM